MSNIPATASPKPPNSLDAFLSQKMRLAAAIERVAGELAHPHLQLSAAGSLRPTLDNRNVILGQAVEVVHKGIGPSNHVEVIAANLTEVKPVRVTWCSGNLVDGRRGTEKRDLAQGWLPLRKQVRRLLRLLERRPERTLFRGRGQMLLRAQAREPLRQQGR
jgi:hypothetical protein